MVNITSPKLLSQIPAAGGPPALTDSLVGVGAGPIDLRYSLSQVQASISGRTKLTADRTWYVSTSGNDSNDGSLAHPWFTVQHAGNWIAENIDTAGFQVFVDIGPGTVPGIYHPSYFGGGIIQFNGSGSGSTFLTPVPPNTGSSALVVNSCFGNVLGQVSVVSVNKVTLLENLGSHACLSNYGLAFICAGDATSNLDPFDIIMDIGHNSWGVEAGGYGAAVYMAPNTTSLPGGTFNIQSTPGNPFGFILNEMGSATILTVNATVIGNPDWGSAGLRTTSAGLIVNNSATFSGAAIDIRYLCEEGGHIDDNFAGYNFFPGSANGTIDGTSIYGEVKMMRVLPPNPSGTQTFNDTGMFVFPFNNTVPITILIKALTVGNTQYPDPVNIFAGGTGMLRFVNVGTGGVTLKGDTGVTVNGVLAGSVAMPAAYSGMVGYLQGRDNWVFVPGLSL